MFNKVFKNKKRAVSPVIAVVLLIALTVAATAIIWGVTSGFFETEASVTITTTSTNSTTPSWSGTITVSAAGELTAVSFGGTWTMLNLSPGGDLKSGANPVTITFSGGAVTPGTYDISFTFIADGSEKQSAGTVSATFS